MSDIVPYDDDELEFIFRPYVEDDDGDGKARIEWFNPAQLPPKVVGRPKKMIFRGFQANAVPREVPRLKAWTTSRSMAKEFATGSHIFYAPGLRRVGEYAIILACKPGDCILVNRMPFMKGHTFAKENEILPLDPVCDFKVVYQQILRHDQR